MARSLLQGRSGVVGAVIGERLRYAFRDPVAVSLLAAVSERLGELNGGLLLLAADQHGHGPTVEQVAAVPMDAVIFATCGADDDPALLHLLQRGVPVVGIDGPCIPGVADLDDRVGTAAIVRHLLSLGHQHFATVTLPLRLDNRRGLVDDRRRARIAYADCRERLAGVDDVLPTRPPTIEAAANVIEDGERAGRELLQSPTTTATPRPTAVIAQSDLLAVGVVQAAETLGLRVPDDLSVAGFDGIETPWLGRRVLTTVEQPVEEKGRTVGTMISALLAMQARPDNVRFAVRLRPGDTTGPLHSTR